MTGGGSAWLTELLDALERHAQLLQANTIAVRTLLTGSTVFTPFPAGPSAAQDHLRIELALQLTEAERIARRLEELRGELAASATQPIEVPDGQKDSG